MSTAHAQSETIYPCDELARFAWAIALGRDAGRPMSRAKQIIDEDPSFTKVEKKHLSSIVADIYANKAISPDDIKRNAEIACRSTSRTR